MTKQSRKDLLKREDAFVLAAEGSAQWMTKHRTPLFAVAGVVLLVGAVVWGATAYSEKRGRDAAQTFSEGWKILEEGVVKSADDKAAKSPEKVAKADGKTAKADSKAEEDRTEHADAPTFATDKDKWTAARQKFQGVVDGVGYRGVGAMAGFLLGDLHDKLGESETAEKVFADLQKKLPANDHLYFLAAERFAYLREQRGDKDGALEALRELAADDKHFYADFAQFHQARLYLAKNDKEHARTVLEHLEKSFPNSSLMEETRTKLAEIGGSAAVDDKAHE